MLYARLQLALVVVAFADQFDQTQLLFQPVSVIFFSVFQLGNHQIAGNVVLSFFAQFDAFFQRIAYFVFSIQVCFQTRDYVSTDS